MSRLPSVREISLRFAARFARTVALLAILVLVPLATAGLLAFQSRALEQVAGAMEHQLANSLKMGDRWQLERTAASLVLSGQISGVWILDSAGNQVLGAGAVPPAGLNYHRGTFGHPGTIGIARHYPLATAGGVAGTVVLRSTLPVQYLFYLATILLGLIGLLWLYAGRHLERLALAIARPMAEVPEWLNDKGATPRFSIAELKVLYEEITRLREREDAARRQEASRAQEAALLHLAVQVSHDIRAPVAALQSELNRAEPPGPEALDLLRACAKRIEGIADDLLGGYRNRDAAVLSLEALVRGLVREKNAQRGPALAPVEVSGSLPEVAAICAKEASLNRALSNLLNNACEAGGAGSVRIEFRSDSRFYEVDIVDQGPGIPAEVLAKLGREIITFGKEGNGSGLGVLQARRAIQEAGGELSFHAEPGGGTRVICRFSRS